MDRALSIAVGGILLSAVAAGAAPPAAPESTAAACRGLPTHAELKTALVAATAAETSGLNNHMWATIVNRDGIVCAVAFSGTDRGSQWGASRVISAQKANTAAALGLDKGSSSNGSGQASGLALSTANLYSAVQPGGSLYGLQHSNPVDTAAAYRGPAAQYGLANDPLVGHRIGGINVLRNLLKLDHLAGVGGVSGDATRPDNIVFDITENPAGGTGKSAGGFGHPKCLNTSGSDTLPPVQ